MKIYVRGISCLTSPCLELKEFLQTIHETGKQSVERKKVRYTIHAEIVGNYSHGILIIDKGQRKYPTIESDKETKNIVLNINKTPIGHSMVDFNFFVINLKDGRGIMTSYRGSGGRMSLEDGFQFLYRQAAQAKKKESYKKLTSGKSITNTEKKEIVKELSKEYEKHEFTIKHIMSKDKFEQLLKRMGRVMNFEVVSRPDKSGWARSVSDKVTRETKRVTFQPELDDSKLKQVKDFVVEKTKNAISGTVMGKIAGIRRTISTNQRSVVFSDLDYDSVVIDENMKFESIANTPIIKKLHKEMDSQPSYF